MAYSDFTLEKVQKNFDLTISEDFDIFAKVPELEPSILLTKFLAEYAQSSWKIIQKKHGRKWLLRRYCWISENKFSRKLAYFGSGI